MSLGLLLSITEFRIVSKQLPKRTRKSLIIILKSYVKILKAPHQRKNKYEKLS